MQRGVPIFGHADWRPGWTEVEYSYVGVTPGQKGDTRVADNGLLLFKNIPLPKPGPKPGTVKAQKYKTRPEWLAAIREHVMPKRTVLTADDDTIAHWLGISRTLLYDLMKRWGPPRKIDDLKHGRF